MQRPRRPDRCPGPRAGLILDRMTNLLLRRGIVTAAAITFAAGELVVLQSVAGVDVSALVGDSIQQITVAAASVAAAAAALSGWALLAVLERTASRARLLWTVTAIVVLLLSMAVGPPAGITTGARASLALLHLTVGLVVVLGLPRGRTVRQPRAGPANP